MTEPALDRQEAFSGTKEVTEAHRFDVKRLEDYLAVNIADFQRPLEVRQFKGGQSNPTYQLVTPNRKYVLRRKPPGKLLPSAHAVDREFKVISALHPTGFPVAKPYVLCEDESIIGTMFYVMDCVEGRILWDGTLPGMEPEGAQRDLRRDERDARATAQHRLPRHRPSGIRQAGQLCRPPDFALDQAVSTVGDRRRSTRWTS